MAQAIANCPMPFLHMPDAFHACGCGIEIFGASIAACRWSVDAMTGGKDDGWHRLPAMQYRYRLESHNALDVAFCPEALSGGGSGGKSVRLPHVGCCPKNRGIRRPGAAAVAARLQRSSEQGVLAWQRNGTGGFPEHP
jgi:hypothetical protein